jgi:hypothetical protein
MINFFRKIRKKLADDNQLLKYSRYAIGEILLVVVGILIALWINSLYHNYRNNELANIYLSDFKRDLVADTITLNERILANERFVKHIDTIVYVLAAKNELSDEELLWFMEKHSAIMRESYFIPEKITIKQLESSNGSHLISSKELKDLLFQYYTINDRYEQNVEKSVQLYQHNFFNRDFMKAYISDNTFTLEPRLRLSLKRPRFDLNRLRSDDGYISSLLHKSGISREQNASYRSIKVLANDIIKLINSELKQDELN